MEINQAEIEKKAQMSSIEKRFAIGIFISSLFFLIMAVYNQSINWTIIYCIYWNLVLLMCLVHLNEQLKINRKNMKIMAEFLENVGDYLRNQALENLDTIDKSKMS